MLIVNETTLRGVMSAIVGASHSLAERDGTRAVVGTIEEKALRTAALVAINIAVGKTVTTPDQA